jgi:hypothetical protein
MIPWGAVRPVIARSKATKQSSTIRHSGMVRQHQTSEVQLRIGESRDSGFDALHRPGMTIMGWVETQVSVR